MSVKKMLFIYNPLSGKSQIRSNLLDIIDIFVKAGYEVTAHPTQCRGDATRTVIDREPIYDIVVCSGGDGTLDEVVTGMMHSQERIPIGYIPAGSTNDFATSIHIPNNMRKAADTVVEGKDFLCDIGEFNDRNFVYIAAFGLFTDVSYETRQDMKNLLGHMAYMLEGMKRLSTIDSYHMKIKYDGGVIEDEFMYGMITNSVSVGGFRVITGNKIKFDDGVFEVTLIKKPSNPIELNEIAASFVDRRINSECMYSFKASWLDIETDNVNWTLDGEYGGNPTKIRIADAKQALAFKVSQETGVAL